MTHAEEFNEVQDEDWEVVVGEIYKKGQELGLDDGTMDFVAALFDKGYVMDAEGSQFQTRINQSTVIDEKIKTTRNSIKNNVENFIFFSTIDINYLPHPSKKDIYIKSKTFCEKILLTALRENILKRLIILRLPAIVGKRSSDNFITKTLHNFRKNLPVNIWNKNDKYNNLIHINDLNKLIFYFISSKNKSKKTIIDCLSSKPIKLEDLINNLKKKLNSRSKINYINKKNKFKKIKFNLKADYKFFSVKKAIEQLI